MIIIKTNTPELNSGNNKIINLSREAVPHKNYYVHKVPPLPSFTNRIYSYHGNEINLYNLTCTCEISRNKRNQYEQRDIRSLCIHLYYKLLNSPAKEYVDPLTRALLETAAKYNAQHFYKYNFRKENKKIYFAVSDHSEWINVFLQVREENNADYIRFAYNPHLKRWDYGHSPPLTEKIMRTIKIIFKDFIVS